MVQAIQEALEELNDLAKGVLLAVGRASSLSRSEKSNEKVLREVNRAILVIVHAQSRNVQDELQICKWCIQSKKRQRSGDP